MSLYVCDRFINQYVCMHSFVELRLLLSSHLIRLLSSVYQHWGRNDLLMESTFKSATVRGDFGLVSWLLLDVFWLTKNVTYQTNYKQDSKLPADSLSTCENVDNLQSSAFP